MNDLKQKLLLQFRFFFRKVVLLLLLLAAGSGLRAQQITERGNGKISGRIIDSLSGKPVEYSTISLINEESSKIVTGTTADDNGLFKLTELAYGSYKMEVYFIGYKTGVKKNIKISKTNAAITLGDFKLSSVQTTLKEVTITAEKSLIENQIDKMVYNAEKDLTSQGGVATDILKKVPQVSVDVDGNVELQGNSNIRFLINGKPSSVFGNNLSDVLQSIPASQIQSIEVITSPGAKYDAEGTGGIINIILKKSTAQGINGNVSLSAGTRLENGSVNLNARKGNFGMNAFLSGNAQLLSTTINSLDRISQDPASGQTTSLHQNGTSNFTRDGFQTGLGFDWGITKNDNLIGSFTYNYFGNSNMGSTNRQSILQDASNNTLSDIANVIDANNSFKAQTIDWNLNYKKKFKTEGQELELIFTNSNGNNYSYYQQVQRFVTPDSVFNGSSAKNPGTDKQTNISLNYSQPVSKALTIDAGAKTVLNQINSRSDAYLLNIYSDNYDFNASQSTGINYNRNIYAAYASGTFKLKILDIKAGCRYENTETKASFSNAGTVNIQPYNTFVPSIIVSHTFKNNHTIKLSYTRRIQRPDYRDLNPFINSSDPKNLTTGNPNLKPEISDNFELGYNAFFKKGINFNAALFYRGNSYDIQPYTFYYPTYRIGDSLYRNVSVTTRENIGLEKNIGLNLFASVPVTSKINIRSNLSFYQRYIINSINPGSNISGFNYRINVNGSYQVSSTLSIEVFGNFNSPRISAQGKSPSFTTYNFALRKQFFNKKASIAITATNPFNKYVNQKTETVGQNFTLSSVRELPYRSFGINFTYKFGKLEFKKQKEVEDVNLTNPTPGS
jgi:ferric enterobactin receptor